MRTRRRPMYLLLPLALALVGPLMAQPSQDPAEIVRRAVERAEAQTAREAELGFESVYTMIEESLDGDGRVEDADRLTYRRYPLEGVMFDELIARDGEPLEERDLRREQERREDFIEDVRQRREEGRSPTPEDENRVDFDREFVARYDFSLLGDERAGGHSAWVLGLEPKQGDLPVRRRIDHALNHATGRIWISQQDYGLIRIEFQMAESVRFWGGILGTLRNTIGRLEFDRIEPDVWLMTDLDIRLDLRILFANIRRRIVLNWESYAPHEPDAARGRWVE